MKKNNSDTFEGINKNISINDNFFINQASTSTPDMMFYSKEPTRRLNNYDSNLLEEDAYKEVNDDAFKLEYKLFKIEEELKAIDSQIQAAKEIGESNLAEEFFIRKLSLERDYQNLIDAYNSKSFSTKVSDSILGVFNTKTKKNNRHRNSKFSKIYNSLLEKLPKEISSLFELKKSLNKLENLNKSVDELMSMNIPYGENFNKYEQLSKYIIKANSIQANISKQMKNK